MRWSRTGDIADKDIIDVHEQAAVNASVADSEEYRHSHIITNACWAIILWQRSERVEASQPLTEATFRRLEESPDRFIDWVLKEIQYLTHH
jgi:hypothetical protein